MIELHGVEIKKAVWTAEKKNDDGETVTPPYLTITLRIENAGGSQVKTLVDFAEEGATTWTLGAIQKEMK